MGAVQWVTRVGGGGLLGEGVHQLEREETDTVSNMRCYVRIPERLVVWFLADVSLMNLKGPTLCKIDFTNVF